MNGKTILVTGATSGIGQAIARRFHALGATLVLAARNREKLEAMVEECSGNAYAVSADFTQLDAMKSVFDFCRERKLLLDGAVHSAGITLNRPLKVNDPQQTEQLFRINFGAFMEICHYAASKRYVREGASIIVMSSTSVYGRTKGLAAYSASKAAVETAVKVASAELVGRKIRVNAIRPADVETPMHYAAIAEAPEIVERMPYTQPLGLIKPEKIADMAEYLLSDKACYITGSILTIGAGVI